MLQVSSIFAFLAIAAAAVLYFMLKKELPREICWQGTSSGEIITKCKPSCKSGWFGLAGMTDCHRLLTCADWGTINVNHDDLIGQGLIKKVYKGRWEDFDVAVNRLSDKLYMPDFDHGFEMISGFQHSPFVVQLVGRCGDSYVTEYHWRKSALNIHSYLQGAGQDLNSQMLIRLNLCINYVEILDFLHNSPLGVRVMCDSNDLMKTLDQFLITDDLHLLVNDLDALPEVIHTNGTLVKCGKREVWGDFVAPEQLWSYEDKLFDDNLMPPYDEKTDIWKIPDVCNYFMADVKDSKGVRLQLLKIHQRCKEIDPQSRPTAAVVLKQYRDIIDRYLNYSFSFVLCQFSYDYDNML